MFVALQEFLLWFPCGWGEAVAWVHLCQAASHLQSWGLSHMPKLGKGYWWQCDLTKKMQKPGHSTPITAMGGNMHSSMGLWKASHVWDSGKV